MTCMWTETWNERLIQCQIKTNESIDEHGRAYCLGHRIKVDEINKSRHKNCINKEKLIKQLRDDKYFLEDANIRWPVININSLITEIENGEFDND